MTIKISTSMLDYNTGKGHNLQELTEEGTKEIIIGRGNHADIRLGYDKGRQAVPDVSGIRTVSKEHAKIFTKGGSFYLKVFPEKNLISYFSFDAEKKIKGEWEYLPGDEDKLPEFGKLYFGSYGPIGIINIESEDSLKSFNSFLDLLKGGN